MTALPRGCPQRRCSPTRCPAWKRRRRASTSPRPATPSAPCRSNVFGLQRGPFGDDLDGLDIDQEPTPSTYFAIDRFSSTNGFGAADLQNDILVSNGNGAFGIYRPDVTIGLVASDAIDGLVLDVAAETALFSLDAFSPSTFTFTGLDYVPCVPGHMSPADVCITHFDGRYSLWLPAAALGLRADDNVDALDTVVPEPPGLALVALALVALAVVRRRAALAVPVLAAAAVLPVVAQNRDPTDPGKGFDYVFYGYDPALPRTIVNGFSTNRAMLLLDIDKPGSPRPYPQGPKFKLLAESNTGSGVLEVLTSSPVTNTLIGMQTDPVRFLFTYNGLADNGGAVMLTTDALLEAYGLHYLRAVVNVVHNGRRTRYLVNCPTFVCDVPERPYR